MNLFIDGEGFWKYICFIYYVVLNIKLYFYIIEDMIGILIGCTRKLLLLLETTNRYRIIDNINKSIIGNKLKANSRLLAVLI